MKLKARRSEDALSRGPVYRRYDDGVVAAPRERARTCAAGTPETPGSKIASQTS